MYVSRLQSTSYAQRLETGYRPEALGAVNSRGLATCLSARCSQLLENCICRRPATCDREFVTGE